MANRNSKQRTKPTHVARRNAGRAVKADVALQTQHALQAAVKSSSAAAQVTATVLRDATTSIVHAGIREIDAVAEAAREALRRFLASSQRTTRATVLTLRKAASDAAGSARRAARTTQRAAKVRAVQSVDRAVRQTAQAARRQARAVLG
jgi:hypothetical protein